VRRGFDDGLFEEDLEEALSPLMDEDRGFLHRLVVRTGDDEEEDCDEAVDDGACEGCGVLALGMSTQTSDQVK